MRSKHVFAVFAVFAVVISFSINSFGQGILTPHRHPKNAQQATQSDAPADAIEAPASKTAALPAALPVSAIKINARIEGRVATVRVEHVFRNDTDDLLEGTYYFPVPEGATLLEFALYDGDERRVGRVKEKEEARSQYATAVGQGEDPAILEMTRNGWFKSHVYPIPPHSEKRVEILYSQVLADKDGVVTFDYPLGHGYKKLKTPVDRVEVDVDLRSEVAIKNIFSPTHPLDIYQEGDRHTTCKVTTMGGGGAENFQLVYSLSDEEIGMSLITYRKKGKDGYFLLMLSPKVEFDRQRISAKDVLFVVDVSLSMQGQKIRQAKEALRFGLSRTLKEEDRFNIITFAGSVKPMRSQMIDATPANVAEARDFVDRLKLDAATNINDALIAAMGMFNNDKRLHNIVFITDGQPNESVTDPDRIAANVRSANATGGRLFTFGVGPDVNRLLLEKLSAQNRGAGSDISDLSQVEGVLSGFFSKVSQPILSDLHVDFGPVLTDRVLPAELPDLYTRSQIKIYGRYRNEQDLKDVTVALTGQMSQQPQRFEFSRLHFPLFTDDKDFLPKLWATERVGALLAQIRISGERAELKQEVVDLAREFNLVTPYTSMYVPTSAELAREKMNSVPDKPASDVPQAAPPGQATNMNTAPPRPGAVVDSSGAVIPNATVIIKDQKTGATRTVTTDESGNYDVAGLPPGTYNMEVTAPGFKKVEIRDVEVKPGQSASASATLSAGGADEAVTVTAGGDALIRSRQTAPLQVLLSTCSTTETVMATVVASVINFTDSRLSSDYESGKIKDLPGLAPIDSLSRLAPGTSKPRFDHLINQADVVNKPGEFRPLINGGGARSIGFILDGYDNNDIDGQPVISIKNFDAVDMLQVITMRGAGDLSRPVASSINLITRTGTNEFHGTVFDYHLNRALGALSPLERRAGPDNLSRFKSDIFGGTFGGPLRRDRVFFFGAFEHETATSSAFVDSTSSMLTPTRKGLEQLSGRFPGSQTVSDLVARGPLARTIGSPRITRTFSIPVLGTPVEFGEVVRFIPSKTIGYEAGTRLNFQLTNRDRLDVSYWYDSHMVTDSIGRLAAGYTGDRDGRAQLWGLNWTKLISSRSANDLSFSINRARLSLNPAGDSSEFPDSPTQTARGLLTLGVSVGPRGINYGDSLFLPSSHVSTLFEVSETLSHFASRHSLKLGGQVRLRLTGLNQLPGSRGQFTYSSFEDFVQDRASAVTIAIGNPAARF
ncbi:MAG TPA: VIT domain-containing protein, partial [Blastocatellia bacterium]